MLVQRVQPRSNRSRTTCKCGTLCGSSSRFTADFRGAAQCDLTALSRVNGRRNRRPKLGRPENHVMRSRSGVGTCIYSLERLQCISLTRVAGANCRRRFTHLTQPYLSISPRVAGRLTNGTGRRVRFPTRRRGFNVIARPHLLVSPQCARRLSFRMGRDQSC